MRKSQARGQIECFHASRMGVLLGSNLLADSVGCICPTSGRRAAHACPWQAEPEALHLPIRRRWLKDTWWVLRERRVVAQTDGGGRWRTRLAAGTGAHHNCRRGVPPCSQFNCSFTFPRFRCVGLRSARALGDDQAPHPSLSPHFALQPRRASASERLRPCPCRNPPPRHLQLPRPCCCWHLLSAVAASLAPLCTMASTKVLFFGTWLLTLAGGLVVLGGLGSLTAVRRACKPVLARACKPCWHLRCRRRQIVLGA